MTNPIKIKRKVVLLGDSAVGKTSLIRRFVMDRFDDKYITTIGTKVTKKEVSITKGEANIQLTLMIWDILGQQGYKSIQARSYKGADGVLFVCDLTREDSLENIESYWLAELDKVAQDVPAVLIGNKVDLQDDRKVDDATIEKFARRLDCQFFLSSAKTGENVERLFKSLGEVVVEGIGINGKKDPETETRAVVSLTDAADAIMMEFVESYGDQETAMAVIRTQFGRADLNVGEPTKDALLLAVEYLAEAERDFRSETEVKINLSKRKGMIESCDL